MKKMLVLLLTLTFALLCFSGCSEKSLLDPDEPVTLTLWHTYGEQADSPMNRLVSEFNKTVGKEKGIVISVKLMSSAGKIGGQLAEAQSGTPGALDMPDLFFCHNSDAAKLGAENLLNWNEYFTDEERAGFVPDFLADGIVDEKLVVFPVSKSTHVLYISDREFSRFSAATGATYSDLATWDGFFRTAEKYYEYSGKPFCAFDYIQRAVELNAIEKGAKPDDLYKDGYYDFDNTTLKASYMQFAEALAKGHIMIAELYSNTHVMTGDVPCGAGSSAAVMYYNDTVTYPDNTSEPMELKILPLPQNENCPKYATQAGVGLCAYKTTDRKAEAASVFAHWLTEGERNLAFVAETGYMPVLNDAYKTIESYSFPKESYKELYSALTEVRNTQIFLREPSFVGYYDKVNKLYDELRRVQTTMPERVKNGESAEKLANELWELFRASK
ncbi:MAG: extracellular solute-binding protein [Eubacteriales bacterium]|nr:extracellular solute-binding protein [Eubacteriales bacterium]